MKFDTANKTTGWLDALLYGSLPPGQADAPPMGSRIGQLTRRGLALVLSALMIMIPMGQGQAFAQQPLPGVAPLEEQQGPPPDQGQAPPPDQGQPQGQPLTADQLDQLVAPIALYPDNLVAQVLAASTYPTQVVEADRWLKSQGNAPADQIASGANAMNWDASVKALTAFPSVLAQMDKNIQWTTDLGNAYYNQPQDVMDSVQAMRQKAQSAGHLQSTPQLSVQNDNGAIQIAPANPAVVYVPVYDPWSVWGTPFAPYPGFYYYPPPGIVFGAFGLGFGIGIGIGLWGHWGWGWGHWGVGWGPRWGGRGVFFNHNTYFSRSTTVINRGFGRPGGPGRGFGPRGAYARGGGFNRGAAGFNRGGAGVNRGGAGFNRGGAAVNRGGGGFNRGGAGAGRVGGGAGFNRGAAGGGARVGGAARPAGGGARPAGGGGRAGGGGHGGGGGGHHK